MSEYNDLNFNTTNNSENDTTNDKIIIRLFKLDQNEEKSQ